MKNLMYVGRYNSTRDFAAEVITKSRVSSNQLHVSSAGINASGRMSTGETMRHYLLQKGYNSPPHNPTEIKESYLKQQDLILCIKDEYIKDVLSAAPGVEGKVFSLAEYSGHPEIEIINPLKVIREPQSWLGNKASTGLYKMLTGYVKSTDESAKRSVYTDTITQIEEMVEDALIRMKQERLITFFRKK